MNSLPEACDVPGLPEFAAPRRVIHGGTLTLEHMIPARPDAEDHLRIPSRQNDRRVYRKDSGHGAQ